MAVRSFPKTNRVSTGTGCSSVKVSISSTQCTNSLSVRTRKKAPSYSEQGQSRRLDKFLTRQSAFPSLRLFRLKNNSSVSVQNGVHRRLSSRLPPLDLSRHTTLTDTVEESGVSGDSHLGATCQTDYLTRIGNKFSRESTVTGTETVNQIVDAVGKGTKELNKLKPIIIRKRQTEQTQKNASHILNSELRSVSFNQSNTVQVAELPKRKVSNFNMRNTPSCVITPVSLVTKNTLTKDDQISSASAQNRSSEIVMTEADGSNSDSLKHSMKSKLPEETEELGSRDRYLAVMEEMLKRHKGLSTRSQRNANGVGGNSASVVPGRRIQPLSIIPEDPLMRFTGRHVCHSMGFKVPEKSESLMVEPDHEQIYQAALLQECEAMFAGRTVKKFSHRRHTAVRSDNLQTTEATGGRAGSVLKTTRTADAFSWDESSLEPLDSEKDTFGSTSEDEEQEEEKEEKEEGATHRAKTARARSAQTRSHRTPQIDVNRVYFYFNPVVQVYPNQTPWRVRSTLPSNAEPLSSTEDANTKSSQKERKSDERFLTSLELTDGSFSMRRSLSALLERSLSTDKLLEMRQAMRAVQTTRSSSSSLSDLQSSSNSSDNTDWNQQGRLIRSFSDGVIVCDSHDLLRSSSPLRLDMISVGASVTDRTIIAPSGQQRARGSLSIHDIMYSSVDNSGRPFHRHERDSKQHDDSEDGAAAADDRRDSYVGGGIAKGEVDGENDPLGEEIKMSKKLPNNTDCEEAYAASVDPNPLAWFDVLEERLANCTRRFTFREKLIAQFRLKGLQKRFVSIPHGLYNLQRELEKGWDIRPKPELLMSCVVKHHMLKMPMNTPNPSLVEKIYINSIVRYPVLYKLIMRRREILPQEIQHFLNRIMELTETSDRMLASISSSTTKLAALTTAAKEQDASGFMTGGPKVKQTQREPKSSVNSVNRTHVSRTSTSSRTGLPARSDSDTTFTDISDVVSKSNPAKKDGGFCTTYAKETDFDKGFYTVLRNPCTNILEEVALLNPEFAWHVRPLFEHRWATLEEDLLEQMFQQKTQTNFYVTKTESCEHLGTINQLHNNASSIKTNRAGGFSQWPEALEYCKSLVYRVLETLASDENQKPGSRVYTDLLICLHMTNYYTELTDLLVKELDLWVPPLLCGLENSYSSVREDTCCILAYLVCSYRLITRLHVISKNLLIANISFSVLSAIGHYPESYAFYHGLLGYMLHAVPCLSTLDCLLLWLPSVQNNENNLVSRDWSLYVYYVLRHWPRNPFYLDAMYQKKLLRPLEISYLTKHAKRSARLALSYLVRTCHVRSALLICWPESEEEGAAE